MKKETPLTGGDRPGQGVGIQRVASAEKRRIKNHQTNPLMNDP
jgi:hypothetical protein